MSEAGSDAWRLSDRIPQISGLLAKLVRPESGLPLDARAIFGSELGPMLWLDRDWVVDHREELFPASELRREYSRAVWETYLVYGRPYTVALDLFADQYARSIDDLPAEGAEGARRRDVAFRVAEHLMTYYWQESLPFEDRDGHLRRFFERAGPETRQYALEFIGRSLMSSGDVPPEALALIRKLIEWRIGVVRQAAAVGEQPSSAAELRAFGWWFASSKFQPDWALQALLDVLRLGTQVEPAHMVAKQLVSLADNHPLQVAEVLRLMIELGRREFAVSGWQEEARDLFDKLGRVEDARVRSFVTAAVDALLAQGYVEFRGLMPA
jgi:hypothetical protein